MKLIKLIISNFRGLKGSNVIDFTNSNLNWTKQYWKIIFSKSI